MKLKRVLTLSVTRTVAALMQIKQKGKHYVHQPIITVSVEHLLPFGT